MRMVISILAVARTEFRFTFRRGAPVVVTALVGLLIAAGVLVGPLAGLPDWAADAAMTPEKWSRWSSFGFTLQEYNVFRKEALSDMFVFSTLLAWMLGLLFLFFLPIATAASLPADRRHGVSELLHSTPIDGWSYLLGKIAGTLTAVITTAAAVLACFFLVSNAVLTVNLGHGLSLNASLFLIQLSLLDGLPMLVTGVTVGITSGVFFRSPRAAILPGILAGTFTLAGWASAFLQRAEGPFNSLDLVHLRLLQAYDSPALALGARAVGEDVFSSFTGNSPPVGTGQIVWMYLALLAVLIVLTVLARLWLKWKENF